METPEAHSGNEELTRLRQQALNMIPGLLLRPFFIRPHLKREFIIGLIGMRGDGKSGSGASISLIDFAMRGVPVWSNMSINCDIEIDERTAQGYGLRRGGKAHYESQELDKDALLKLDERYVRSFIWIDEINVQYSNIRRFMSNTNVDFNIVVQELRKFHTSMGYSVIDEMFIDSQLRSLTDVFVKCEDTALSVEGLASRKPTGVDFKWTIYPMSGYLVGRENSYSFTQKPLPPVYFHFQPFRGIYNTDLFQRKGKYSVSSRDKTMSSEITTEASEEVREQYNKWGWLEEKAIQLRDSGRKEISKVELYQFLDLQGRGINPNSIHGQLPMYGITKERNSSTYRIERYQVSEPVPVG